MRINQEKNFNLNTTLTGAPSNTSLNFKQINKSLSVSARWQSLEGVLLA